eukprot:TRINITY_DN3913_c2_g1_i1.p1 TRINITY_DN3913_c2_g1~~TRINITY_DN3913_c2_g1_i1.p1  ORF type:complete len:1006 (+),score=151.16 TRINITY_DN3913_c2_g1_i1:66-3083(+)
MKFRPLVIVSLLALYTVVLVTALQRMQLLDQQTPALGKQQDELLKAKALKNTIDEHQRELKLELSKDIQDLKNEVLKLRESHNEKASEYNQTVQKLEGKVNELADNLTSTYDYAVRARTAADAANHKLNALPDVIQAKLPTLPPRNVTLSLPPGAPNPRQKGKPTPMPTPNPVCQMKFQALKDSPFNWLNFGLETSRGEPVRAVDVTAGTLVLALAVNATLQPCLSIATSAIDLDPYIEQHRLKVNPPNSVCDKKLREELSSVFGEPTDPHSDVWYIVSNRKFGSNGWFMIQIRPRKTFPTDQDFTAEFNFPMECLRVLPAEGLMIPTLKIDIKAGTTPTIKLAGDLREGLHDGVLADGGRLGTLIATHGVGWKFNDKHFQEGVRQYLSDTFGEPDPGTTDAVLQGWDASTLSFILAPREISTNQNGIREITCAEVPTTLIDHSTPLKIVEKIQIEDVITPFSELKSELLPMVTSEDFIKGGGRLHFKLSAGVFFQSQSKLLPLLRDELTRVYGETSGMADEINILSPTELEVTLGERNMQTVPWTKQKEGEAKTHSVLRLVLSPSMLLQTVSNCSSHCYKPGVDGCDYHQYIPNVADTIAEGVAPFPALVVTLPKKNPAQPALIVKWAVIGAGPSGTNGMGRVFDQQNGTNSQILWIDERGFKVGRLEGYHDVQSMNACSDFLAYMNDYNCFKNFPLGESKRPLEAYEMNKKHCRLGFLSEPLLKATHLIRSHVVSVVGRVSDMHKVWYDKGRRSNSSSDFVWSLRVGNSDPVWVTDGVIVAIGADHAGATFPPNVTSSEMPTDIPFTTALNPGLLRTFVNTNQKRSRNPEGKKHVLVFGAGPSGVVALHNLALTPEVGRVTHVVKFFRSEYTQLVPPRPDGSLLNVTRSIYNVKNVTDLFSDADYMIQCVGWRFPKFPYNGSLMPTGKSQTTYVGPKLFNIGVRHSAGHPKAQLFFISHLRSSSKPHATCLKNDTECMSRMIAPFPETLEDPNKDAQGGYVAT